MKVLHVIRYVDISGGAERLVADIVKNNKNHFVITTMLSSKQPFSYKIPPEKIIYKQSVLGVLSYLFFNKKKYDLYHLHLFPMIYLAFFFKKQTIIHEHNTWNIRRNFKCLNYIEGYIYKSSSAIVAISDATKSSLQKWLDINKKLNIYVINNFTTFKNRTSLKINKLNLKKDRVRLLMVGSFSEQKLQIDLVRLFSYLPNNFELILIGSGNEKLVHQCQVEMDELNINGTILNNVENISDYYQSADICVLLSKWEGFGLVVLEALSFGKPTFVSNVPGVKELVFSKKMLIDNKATDKQKAQMILNGILFFNANREGFMRYSENILNKYSFDEFMNSIERVYSGYKKV